MSVNVNLTIITVNYNNLDGLNRTLSNIALLKKLHKFQFIVVDGASTDGSVQSLYSNLHIIDKLISEKDSGIYDAMNKGVQHADGDYIAFINSGDFININDVDELFNIRLNQGHHDIIYGDYFILNHRTYKWRSNLTSEYLWKGYFCHQSMYVKRSLLMKYPFNTEQKICGDTEFILTVLTKSNPKVLKLDKPLCIIESGGVSDTKRIKSILAQRQVTIRSKITNRLKIESHFTYLLIKNLCLQALRNFGLKR